MAPPVPSATDGSAQHNGRRRGALRPWGGRARGSPAPPRVPWALGRPHRPHPSPPDREPQAPSLLTTLVSAFDEGGELRDVAGGRQGQADSGVLQGSPGGRSVSPASAPRLPWALAPAGAHSPELPPLGCLLSSPVTRATEALPGAAAAPHPAAPPAARTSAPQEPPWTASALCPVSSSLSDLAPPDCHAQHTPGSTPRVTMALFDSLEWSRLPRTRQGVCLADPLLPRPVQDGRGTCAGGTARAAAGSVTREGQRGWPVRQLALQP